MERVGGFKIGDKVVCVDNNRIDLTNGRIYEVYGLNGETYLKVFDDRKVLRSFYPHRFRKATSLDEVLE